MIILFGLAGSGKGTQGKALSEIFGWRWISMGQLIRAAGEWDEVISKGGMVPNEYSCSLLEKEIAKNEAEGFDVVLDGFPRNAEQAEWLVNHLASNKIYGALVLDVPKEELYHRLELRAISEARDDDQDRASIDRRFEIFEENIGQILPILEAHRVPVVHVDGVGEVNEVTGRLVGVVKKLEPGATVQKDDVNGEEIEKSYGE